MGWTESLTAPGQKGPADLPLECGRSKRKKSSDLCHSWDPPLVLGSSMGTWYDCKWCQGHVTGGGEAKGVALLVGRGALCFWVTEMGEPVEEIESNWEFWWGGADLWNSLCWKESYLSLSYRAKRGKRHKAFATYTCALEAGPSKRQLHRDLQTSRLGSMNHLSDLTHRMKMTVLVAMGLKWDM